MIVLLVTPLLAGLLGIATAQVEDAGGYLAHLRFLFLGATMVGYFGVFWFSWRRGRGPRAVLAMLAGLLAVRILYPLILILAVIVTGWIDWAAARSGNGASVGVLHYTLGLFIGAFAVAAALIGATAVTNVTRPKWLITLVVLAAVGFFSFTGPDGSIAPYPRKASTAITSTEGPTAWQSAKDDKRPWRVRVLSVCAAGFQAAMPRSAWGGVVRNQLRAYSRGTPEASLTERVRILEQALLKARPTPP